MSSIRKSLQDHAEMIAKETLFTDVAGLEVVQAFSRSVKEEGE